MCTTSMNRKGSGKESTVSRSKTLRPHWGPMCTTHARCVPMDIGILCAKIQLMATKVTCTHGRTWTEHKLGGIWACGGTLPERFCPCVCVCV